jgi:toxin HigB-1
LPLQPFRDIEETGSARGRLECPIALSFAPMHCPSAVALRIGARKSWAASRVATSPHKRDKLTEAVFNGESPKGFPADLVKAARRKLRYLNATADLGDLRSPPGNRLEKLAGERKGQYSISINDQFRVCFIWTAEGPAEVEIVDYH